MKTLSMPKLWLLLLLLLPPTTGWAGTALLFYQNPEPHRQEQSVTPELEQEAQKILKWGNFTMGAAIVSIALAPLVFILPPALLLMQIFGIMVIALGVFTLIQAKRVERRYRQIYKSPEDQPGFQKLKKASKRSVIGFLGLVVSRAVYYLVIRLAFD